MERKKMAKDTQRVDCNSVHGRSVSLTSFHWICAGCGRGWTSSVFLSAVVPLEGDVIVCPTCRYKNEQRKIHLEGQDSDSVQKSDGVGALVGAGGPASGEKPV